MSRSTDQTGSIPSEAFGDLDRKEPIFHEIVRPKGLVMTDKAGLSRGLQAEPVVLVPTSPSSLKAKAIQRSFPRPSSPPERISSPSAELPHPLTCWESRGQQQELLLEELTQLDSEPGPAADQLVALLQTLGQVALKTTRNKHRIYNILLHSRDICNNILADPDSLCNSDANVIDSVDGAIAPEVVLGAMGRFYNLIDTLEKTLLEVATVIPAELETFGPQALSSWDQSRVALCRIWNILHREPFKEIPLSWRVDFHDSCLFDDCAWLSRLLHEIIEPEIALQFSKDQENPPSVISTIQGFTLLENIIKCRSSAEPFRDTVIDMATLLAKMLSETTLPAEAQVGAHQNARKSRTLGAENRDWLLGVLAGIFSILETGSSLNPVDTSPIDRPAEFPPPIELKRGRERKIKPTRLTRIAELSNPEWERVQPFLSPPWRRTRWEKDLRGRMKISLPIPGEPKGDAAMRMSKEIEKWEKDPDRLLVFTDGSLIVTKDSRRTGAGMVAYQGRQEIWTGNFGLGSQAEVYDAEMAGLGVAAKTITNILRDRESGISAKRIHFLADNSAAIQTIFEEKPRGAQHWSTMFRNAVLQFLDESEEHEVEINWVPGHQDIKGNEKSDEEAKKGSSAAALRPFTSLAHAKSMARAKARMKWRAEWARGTAGSFALADRCPPSTEPRPHFFKLPRRVYGLVTQARSGHAFMGEYYRRFVPSEETGCPCGEADPQTRRHIIQECGLYDVYRHILEEEVPDLNLADILGSDRGICALAEFIAKSGAFKKAG